MPEEMKGLLEKEKRVIVVEGTDPELMKRIVKREVEKLFGPAPPGKGAQGVREEQAATTSV